MDKVLVYEKTLGKQAQRIADLTLDLDLAHAQIELLNEQLKENNSDKEKGSE